MPITNDNFADALTLLANVWQAGTNQGASREAGEPANNGKTIWWSWTAQDNGTVIASTHTNDAIAISYRLSLIPPLTLPGQGDQQSNAINQFTNFYSKVQVFTANNPGSPAVNNLSEVKYTSVTGAANEFGQAVAFQAVSGTTYYIRIDSRLTDSTNTGNACLILYPCACSEGCALTPNVSGFGSLSFGNYPPGTYTIKYCAGAFVVGTNAWASLNWPGGPGGSAVPDPFGNYTGYYVVYNNGKAFKGFNTPSQEYTTAAAAAAAAQGASVTINHTGGPILIEFVDDLYTDNLGGSPSPTFTITPHCVSVCPTGLQILSAGIQCEGGDLVFQVVAAASATGFLQAALQLTLTGIGGMTLPTTSAWAWGAVYNIQGVPNAIYKWSLPVAGFLNSSQISVSINIASQSGDVCATQNFSEPFNWGLSANGATFARVGQIITGIFSVDMNASFSCATLFGCTVTLQTTGGVVAPSAPLTGVSFSNSAPTSLEFTFQSVLLGNDPIVATIKIQDAQGNLLATLNYSIGTSIVVSGSAGGVQHSGVGNGCFFRSGSITVQNLGQLSSYPVTLTPTAGALGSCENNSFNFGSIPAGQSSTQGSLFLPPSPMTYHVTETAPDGTVISYPDFTL